MMCTVQCEFAEKNVTFARRMESVFAYLIRVKYSPTALELKENFTEDKSKYLSIF